MASVTALVPMKGHSERVPGKNLRPIAGRPLFAWVLTALSGAERVERVVVDTDSEEIAAAVFADFPSVSVHRRPEHLRGDFVPVHDIVAFLAAETPGDVFLQTHATNPLLLPGTIDRAIDTFFEDGEHDSLMGVTARRSRFFAADGTPINHDPAVLGRTQDLPPVYEENSNLYIAPRDLILATGRRVGPNARFFEMDTAEAWDIDDEIDFFIAECLLRGRADG